MSETIGNGRRETLRLEVDQPVTASLLFDTPLPVQGRWGDQFMYTLETDSGERVLYVDPAVRALIDELGIRRGDTFRIGKMSRRDGNRRGVEWKVRKLDPEAPAPQPREQTEAGHPRTDQQVANRPQPSTPAPAEPSSVPFAGRADGQVILSALVNMVDIVAAVEQYARAKGRELEFTSEDIRALTITSFIQRVRGGQR